MRSDEWAQSHEVQAIKGQSGEFGKRVEKVRVLIWAETSGGGAALWKRIFIRKFLGYSFLKRKGGFLRRTATRSLERLKDKLRESTDSSTVGWATSGWPRP